MQAEATPSSASTTIQDLSADEVVAAILAEHRRRRQPAPRWERFALRVLPGVLPSATVANGLIGLFAIIAPLLRAALGRDATAWLYAAYSMICPQRPSHTTFVMGEPMAMEQRMVAMYLAFGIAGLLYAGWARWRRPLSSALLLAGVAPAVLDVFLSTAGLRASTPLSRWTTGAVASMAIVRWAYPRFDALSRATLALVETRSAASPAADRQS